MAVAPITSQKTNKWIKSIQEINARTWLGLLGIFLAVMVSGIGEGASKIALFDIQGKISLDIDSGSWLTTCYIIGFIFGTAFTPNLWITFSLRRVALVSTGIYFLTSLLIPFLWDGYFPTIFLRGLQGLSGGALPPMLMVGVLRFVPPLIKVLGLSFYSWVAVWGITMGASAGSFAFNWGVEGYFFWNLPVMALAILLIWIGIPQDPLHLERLKKFNWRGLFLGGASLAMLTVGITQGERLYWLQSPLIFTLLIGGGSLLITFLVNEWFQPIPFFNLKLLKNRNLAFALISLGGMTLIMFTLVTITSNYLVSIQGYRQEQLADLMQWTALPQVLLIPIIAVICNWPKVDCRWVFIISLLLMSMAAILSSKITSDWSKGNFYFIFLLQSVAQPMAIIPLLMLATGSVMPMDGPYAAAMFNSVRAFSTTLASGIIPFIIRQRANFHEVTISNDLVLNSPTVKNDEFIYIFSIIDTQSKVLAYADIYLLLIGLNVFVIFLALLYPTRVYPSYFKKQ